MDDQRLAKDIDVVGSRSSRRTEDREVTENRELTEQDRLEMFRNTLFNDALPNLPAMPGYHMCWLTTTNSRDPVHRRLQLGYELLTSDMVPGFEYATLKTGDYAGVVGVNEMVAARLPMSLYEAFMQEVHHDAPRREEEALQRAVDVIKEDVESSGGRVIEGDGMTELRRSAPSRGVFT